VLHFKNNIHIRKTSFPFPPCLSQDQVEKSRKCQEAQTAKDHTSTFSSLFYTQATSLAKNLLKIKEAFLVLSNKKIIEIYNAVISKPVKLGKFKPGTQLGS